MYAGNHAYATHGCRQLQTKASQHQNSLRAATVAHPLVTGRFLLQTKPQHMV